MTERDIRIVPAGRESGSRGAKTILVDGDVWGFAIMNQHGRLGVTYHFVQASSVDQKKATGSLVQYESGLRWKASNRTSLSEYKVRGDKLAERARRGDEPPLKSLEERFIECVRKMIEDGNLQHPETYLAGIRKSNEEYRASAVAKEAAAEARIVERAGLAVTEGMGGAAVEIVLFHKLRDAVVAAMKDAQTW